MKSALYIILIVLISSCTIDSFQKEALITPRTLPDYIVPYQYPSGYVETETSSDLTNWSTGYTASQNTSLYGTTTTIYNFAVPDNERRVITMYQNSNGDLRTVEYEDGANSWTIPASVSSANSPLLPTIELNDGVLYSAHASVADFTGQFVKGNYKTGPTSSWSSTYNLNYYTSGFGTTGQIPTKYSPSLEYHPNTGIEYLIAPIIDQGTGYGLPLVYWRYTGSIYFLTSSPNISLGTSSPSELNASITPVAVEDDLYLFYTIPGSSQQSELEIKYVYGTVTGSGNGAISGNWSNPATISGAYTHHKIDGFYEDDTERIVLIFRNYTTGEIDLAISDDFGSTWDLSVTGIASTSGAPSIANLE